MSIEQKALCCLRTSSGIKGTRGNGRLFDVGADDGTDRRWAASARRAALASVDLRVIDVSCVNLQEIQEMLEEVSTNVETYELSQKQAAIA